MTNRFVLLSLLVVCTGVELFAQNANAERPVFEVAVVKVSTSPGAKPVGDGRPSDGGRSEALNVPLKVLILAAYDLQDSMISGGPGWLDSERLDIVAKAPPGTPDTSLKVMYQNLLAEQFKLVIHHEDKLMPACALILGRGKLQLQQSPRGESTCSSSIAEGKIHRDCRNTTMAELAVQVSRFARSRTTAPVVDSTGLNGAYDFHLAWTASPEQTIINSLDAVGLNLVSRQQPVPVVVIDHVERVPVGN